MIDPITATVGYSRWRSKHRNRHRTSRAARQAEQDEAKRKVTLQDLLGKTDAEFAGADSAARKQVGLPGEFAPPSAMYNPEEQEAKARARGLKAVSMARVNQLRKQLGETTL